jgi:hypothetical protein
MTMFLSESKIIFNLSFRAITTLSKDYANGMGFASGMNTAEFLREEPPGTLRSRLKTVRPDVRGVLRGPRRAFHQTRASILYEQT